MNTNCTTQQDITFRDNSTTRTMKRRLARTAGLLLLLGCSLLPDRAIAGEPGKAIGYLQVYSASEQASGTEGSFYFLHTGYRIYDSKGKVVQWVENHNTSTDEAPQQVPLAPGDYTIWAQSDKDGYVTIPVKVTLDRMTTVQLEEKPSPDTAVARSATPAKTSDDQGLDGNS